MDAPELMTPDNLMPADPATEYLLDMIDQMARLARQSGDIHIAILLDAIIAAQHAIEKDRSAA